MRNPERQERLNRALFAAVQRGSDISIPRIIEEGANPNAFNENDLTPLTERLYSSCSNYGNSEGDDEQVYEALAKNGANPDVVDSKGRNFFHHAALHGHFFELCYLAPFSQDLTKAINARDNDGDTPLLLATYNAIYRESSIDFLIQSGADPNVLDNEGRTVLHKYIDYTGRVQEDLVAQLTYQTLNTQDEDGNTPLHLAARHCDKEDVQILLDKGADPTILNNAQELPEHCAEYNEYKDVGNLIQHVRVTAERKSMQEGLQDILNRKEQEEGQVQTKGRLM